MSASTSSRWQAGSDEFDVLLVEDNPGDVRLIREAFEEAGSDAVLYDVTGGEEAMDFLTRTTGSDSAPTPDLVLLDLDLPGRNGGTVLEAIRDDPRLRRLPVLVLTSSNSGDDVARCYRRGANAYLTKPDSHDELVSLVDSVERFWFSRAKLPPL